MGGVEAAQVRRLGDTGCHLERGIAAGPVAAFEHPDIEEARQGLDDPASLVDVVGNDVAGGHRVLMGVEVGDDDRVVGQQIPEGRSGIARFEVADGGDVGRGLQGGRDVVQVSRAQQQHIEHRPRRIGGRLAQGPGFGGLGFGAGVTDDLQGIDVIDQVSHAVVFQREHEALAAVRAPAPRPGRGA